MESLDAVARALFLEGDVSMSKMQWWERPLKEGDRIFWGTRMKYYSEGAQFEWVGQPEDLRIIKVTKVFGDIRIQIDG